MTNVADRMLDLLLVPLTDPQWIKLIKELEVSGSVLSKEPLGQKAFHYSLSNLGVDLYTDRHGWVMNVHFLVGPTYLSELPFGLRPGFRTSDVHERLGLPVCSNQPEKGESFSFDNFRVTVFYSFEDETLKVIRLFRVGESKSE